MAPVAVSNVPSVPVLDWKSTTLPSMYRVVLVALVVPRKVSAKFENVVVPTQFATALHEAFVVLARNRSPLERTHAVPWRSTVMWLGVVGRHVIVPMSVNVRAGG